MTHKIKVQMFGNFRMDYNGAPFVAEKMHKESQFNRMMQALIHYSDCGIAKDKLEEIVIGERDIDAPHTALRVIVYKTKQKLAQLGLPGKNLVYLEGGIYYWTPDIEIEEDAAEFEKLYNEACALEKQMPHEPESAETVCDERIKEIEDNMLELYIKALYLYKGEFLAAYTGETWIAQEARRYHTMFEKIINEAAYILRKRKQFKGLEKLGVYAAKVDPFNEWEELIMEAMVETRRYDEAEELYTDVVDYYLRECGIYPSSRLLEILEKWVIQMSVFDFTLLSGYEFSGVDVAQGFRARLFAKNNVNAKFIFTELPTIRDMELYGSQKIKRGQIMSAHLFMTGRLDMSLSVKKEALLENEKENYEYDNIDEDGKVIRLYNSGEKSVEILCDEDGFVINESLFKNGKKYLVNYYTDSLSYTELYNWDNDSNDGLNLGRRIFWNKQGQMVYEQCIYKDNVEYLFKNGEVIDNVEFLERFVKALNLCENDICIMDRAGYLDYIQPLFENKGKSKLIAVLHSDHFYKIYEDESSLYMNYEYYYWFKYSEAIDYFVVGTDEHKRSLEAFLKEYDCFVPHIAAIPPGAIPEGKLKSKNNRWRGSIISASRLSPRKGIDILIKSVIKAHEINQTINLDIYGSGDDGYTIYLKNIVKDACADDYIHFKGRCNLEKIYPHYEMFASFSLWETFGLSLMEAVGDGLAMVGLDVRYGNRLFIHQDENGYLVDFDIETDFQNKDKLCERTAAAIVKIFEDDDRLKKFHENSYMIAEEYKEHVIESKWMQLIKNILDLNPSNLIL